MKASEIRIPEPCNENWEGMTPEQRGRFCGACQKKVHDLSAMSESEAKALLGSGQDICVSYLSDAAGQVRFRPQPVVPVTRLLRRASVATAAGLSLALAACAPHGEGPKLEVENERPAFLEVTPAIPDAEPCETEAPEAPIVEESDDLIRTKGDYAAPPPPPPIKDVDRRKGRIRRTAGKPMQIRPDDPLAGL